MLVQDTLTGYFHEVPDASFTKETRWCPDQLIQGTRIAFGGACYQRCCLPLLPGSRRL